MNPPGHLRVRLASFVVEQGVALVGRGSVALKISQPQLTAPIPSQGYLEELQVPDREAVGEETVPGGGEDVVVGCLPPGLSPEVRAVWRDPAGPAGC